MGCIAAPPRLMDVMQALKVSGLSKSFGGRKAVRAVSFAVSAGQAVAFLGPNGAGKSTTLRMIAGFLEPDAGDAEIGGASIITARSAAQRSLGYLDLSVRAFLGFLARTHGLSAAATKDAIARVAQDASIAEVMAARIETLSKGYRRRVALAGALVHDPAVLVLDEPTDGLDPNQKVAMRSLIRRMAETKAILISTHQLDEVEAMCSRVVLIDRGIIVTDTTRAELAAQTPGGRLEDAFHALTQMERAA